MQEFHVILHVIVHADDEEHAKAQASEMFDDNVVVADSNKGCDELLLYYASFDEEGI